MWRASHSLEGGYMYLRVSLGLVCRSHVTEFAPHHTMQSNTRCKLTLDERVECHRVEEYNYLSIRYILGDIRLWEGDTSTLRVEESKGFRHLLVLCPSPEPTSPTPGYHPCVSGWLLVLCEAFAFCRGHNFT